MGPQWATKDLAAREAPREDPPPPLSTGLPPWSPPLVEAGPRETPVEVAVVDWSAIEPPTEPQTAPHLANNAEGVGFKVAPGGLESSTLARPRTAPSSRPLTQEPIVWLPARSAITDLAPPFAILEPFCLFS